MKWLGRFLAFALAILVGTTAAWVGSILTADLGRFDVTEPVIQNKTEAASPVEPSGVTVAYSGLGSDANGEHYLKFIVHNGLYRPITYGSHNPNSPFASVKANGKELPVLGRCGTGIQTFYILPGRSAEFHVYPYEFITLAKKDDRISAGFYLKPAFSSEYGPYYSEPFILPEEFRKSIEARLHNN